MLEGDETVVHALIKLPVLQRVVDLGIQRARRRIGNEAHLSTAVIGGSQLRGRRRSCLGAGDDRAGECGGPDQPNHSTHGCYPFLFFPLGEGHFLRS